MDCITQNKHNSYIQCYEEDNFSKNCLGTFVVEVITRGGIENKNKHVI